MDRDRLLYETTYLSGKILRVVQRHNRVALEMHDGARVHIMNIPREIISDVINALLTVLDPATDERSVHHAWDGDGARPPGVPRGRVSP